MTTTVLSAYADIADENELRFGVRQQGILYSTQTFFARIDQAIGAALAGWALTCDRLSGERDAQPRARAGVAGAGRGVWVLSTLPGLLTAYFYGRLGITSESYAATRAALDAAPASRAA